MYFLFFSITNVRVFQLRLACQNDLNLPASYCTEGTDGGCEMFWSWWGKAAGQNHYSGQTSG